MFLLIFIIISFVNNYRTALLCITLHHPSAFARDIAWLNIIMVYVMTRARIYMHYIKKKKMCIYIILNSLPTKKLKNVLGIYINIKTLINEKNPFILLVLSWL